MRRLTRLAVLAATLVTTIGLSGCQGNGPGAASTDTNALNVYANGDTNVQSLWTDI